MTAKSISPRQMAVRRFLGHKPAVIAAVILLVMIIYVVLAPITARYGVNEPVFQTTAEQSNRYLSPQSVAWFGTDEIGRDLYSRLIYGTQVSLQIGLAAAIIGVVIGAAVGAVRRHARRALRRRDDAGDRHLPRLPVPRRAAGDAQLPR